MKRLQIKRAVRLLILVGVLSLMLLGVSGLLAASGGAARWAANEARLAASAEAPADIAGPDDHVLVSFMRPGTASVNCDTGEPIHYGVGDAILYWANRGCWLPWFNAAGSGLPASADINALHDECGPDEPRCEIYLSFTKAIQVPGVGKVYPQDVVVGQWIEGTLDLYHNFGLAFDGSDVGLTTPSERIDALFVFDEDRPAAYADCAILGWLSTVGNYRVRDQWGRWLVGGGEDVLGFCGSSIGANTAGYWFLYHDGSAEGMPTNGLIGLAHEEGARAYGRFNFLTKGAINVDDAHGGAGQVFEFSSYTGDRYRGPLLDFWADLGASGIPDSIHIYYYD